MSAANARRARLFAALLAVAAAGGAQAADDGAAFDCAAAPSGSVGQRICADETLGALDRQLAAVYQAASAETRGAAAGQLATAQRAWVKTRNDCWKAQDVAACISTAYRDRISELQARYRLLPPAASARYQCPGPPPQEVVVDYLATDPPTAMVTYAGDAQFMRAAPSGSGARYRGGNRQFWEHQGVGLLVWDLRVGEVRCARP